MEHCNEAVLSQQNAYRVGQVDKSSRDTEQNETKTSNRKEIVNHYYDKNYLLNSSQTDSKPLSGPSRIDKNLDDTCVEENTTVNNTKDKQKNKNFGCDETINNNNSSNTNKNDPSHKRGIYLDSTEITQNKNEINTSSVTVDDIESFRTPSSSPNFDVREEKLGININPLQTARHNSLEAGPVVDPLGTAHIHSQEVSPAFSGQQTVKKACRGVAESGVQGHATVCFAHSKPGAVTQPNLGTQGATIHSGLNGVAVSLTGLVQSCAGLEEKGTGQAVPLVCKVQDLSDPECSENILKKDSRKTESCSQNDIEQSQLCANNKIDKAFSVTEVLPNTIINCPSNDTDVSPLNTDSPLTTDGLDSSAVPSPNAPNKGLTKNDSLSRLHDPDSCDNSSSDTTNRFLTNTDSPSTSSDPFLCETTSSNITTDRVVEKTDSSSTWSDPFLSETTSSDITIDRVVDKTDSLANIKDQKVCHATKTVDAEKVPLFRPTSPSAVFTDGRCSQISPANEALTLKPSFCDCINGIGFSPISDRQPQGEVAVNCIWPCVDNTGRHVALLSDTGWTYCWPDQYGAIERIVKPVPCIPAHGFSYANNYLYELMMEKDIPAQQKIATSAHIMTSTPNGISQHNSTLVEPKQLNRLSHQYINGFLHMHPGLPKGSNGVTDGMLYPENCLKDSETPSRPAKPTQLPVSSTTTHHYYNNNGLFLPRLKEDSYVLRNKSASDMSIDKLKFELPMAIPSGGSRDSPRVECEMDLQHFSNFSHHFCPLHRNPSLASQHQYRMQQQQQQLLYQRQQLVLNPPNSNGEGHYQHQQYTRHTTCQNSNTRGLNWRRYPCQAFEILRNMNWRDKFQLKFSPISLLWAVISLAVTLSSLVSFVTPFWAVHPDHIHSFGLFNLCIRDPRYSESTSLCVKYGQQEFYQHLHQFNVHQRQRKTNHLTSFSSSSSSSSSSAASSASVVSSALSSDSSISLSHSPSASSLSSMSSSDHILVEADSKEPPNSILKELLKPPRQQPVGLTQIPNGAWQAACLLFGSGVVLHLLSVLLAGLVLVLKEPWHHRLAQFTGYLQTVGGLLLLAGLLLYPIGFSSPFYSYYCESNRAFSTGHCSLGWSYVIAVMSTALSIFCPVLSTFAQAKQPDRKVDGVTGELIS